MTSFSTQAVGSAWKDMLERGIPKPEKYLVSPLVRAIDTMNLTYGELMEDDQKPVVIEASRDLLLVWQTRDRSLTYPAFVKPPGTLFRKHLGSTPYEGESPESCARHVDRWLTPGAQSELADRYPNLTFEQGFPDQDPHQQLGKYMLIKGSTESALNEPIAARKLADEGNAARLDQVRSVMHKIARECPETCE